MKKIALVHDYFNEAGGAERVLRVLSEMYPQAKIYTAFIKQGSAQAMFGDRQIIESKWGKLLKIGRLYSYLRFLLPWIWKSLDLSQYDLVITSCSGYIARGFRVGEKTRVVAYCHTPPKWLYGYETPTDGRNKWWGALYLKIFGPFVRYFDFVSAGRVDVWIANSHEVARRIEKFYRKKAIVIYPAVEIKARIKRERGDYYLTVARVTGAKGLVESARAANMAKRKLVIVGEVVGGEKFKARIKEAGREWVQMKGRVWDEELGELYTGARGYLALAKDEDFGMTVVEAMLAGTPMLALRSGGYLETVVEGKTGIFVDKMETREVVKAIEEMEKMKFSHDEIVESAKKFGRERFEREMRKIIEKEVARARTT